MKTLILAVTMLALPAVAGATEVGTPPSRPVVVLKKTTVFGVRHAPRVVYVLGRSQIVDRLLAEPIGGR